MTESRIDRRPITDAPVRRFAYPTQATFLSQAVLLEEASPPRVPALACLLGFTLVCLVAVTGMLIEIDVVSKSTGRIVASEANHILQSFDGGIVDRIEVEEGQVVEEGGVVLTLHDPEAKAQLARLQARYQALTQQAQRFQTLAGLPVALSPMGARQMTKFSDEQKTIMPLEKAAMASEQALVQAEIDRRLKGLASLHALKKSAVSKLELAEQMLSTHRHLFAQKLAPKTSLLEAEREFTDADFGLTEITGQIQEAEAGILEAGRRLEDVVASTRQKLGDRLSTAAADLSELHQQINAARKRLERGSVKATARGIVHELSVHHPGQTVTPGETLAEVIPIDVGLVAELRLPTTEVGHIHAEQPVRIAIDGLEPHRHGYLQGIVDRVSPSTFIDEDALPYYRVMISLDANELGNVPLVPGMTVQAQIKTGQRTMLEYLLKPIFRAWDTSFRER